MQTTKLTELIATDNQCAGCSTQCKLEFRWISDHYHEDTNNENAHMIKKPEQMVIQMDTHCDGSDESAHLEKKSDLPPPLETESTESTESCGKNEELECFYQGLCWDCAYSCQAQLFPGEEVRRACWYCHAWDEYKEKKLR